MSLVGRPAKVETFLDAAPIERLLFRGLQIGVHGRIVRVPRSPPATLTEPSGSQGLQPPPFGLPLKLPAHDTNPGFHESILGERRVDHLAQQLLAGTVVRSTDGTTILQDAEPLADWEKLAESVPESRLEIRSDMFNTSWRIDGKNLVYRRSTGRMLPPLESACTLPDLCPVCVVRYIAVRLSRRSSQGAPRGEGTRDHRLRLVARARPAPRCRLREIRSGRRVESNLKSAAVLVFRTLAGGFERTAGQHAV